MSRNPGSRNPGSKEFRARFEQLECRELMTADLVNAFRISSLLASSTASNGNTVSVQEVGGQVYYRIALSGSTTAPKTTTVTTPTPAPAPAPAAPAPAPVSTDPNLAWLNANLQDVNLRNLVWSDIQLDKVLDRKDMLGIFTQVQKDGVVSAAEFSDLKKVIGKNEYFVGYDYVDVLATNIIDGDVANLRYQGTTLGNLAAGSSAAQLNKLVNKWFLGTDHPTTIAGLSYQTAAGSLFPTTPSYTDVRQGVIGDCYFVGSLGEAALVNPNLVKSMFIVNGDGTYTVRFYNNGKADYVTVDSMLPADSRGNMAYANMGLNVRDAKAPLWVALAEKAYVQMNESGWLRTAFGDYGGRNSYNAISGGYMFQALAQITGKAGSAIAVDSTKFDAIYKPGALIMFGSVSTPVDAGVVRNHAYAVVSYNKTTVTLFNPWGVSNKSAPGLVTLTWTQLKNNFYDIEYVA